MYFKANLLALFLLVFLTNCNTKKESDLGDTILIPAPTEIRPKLLDEYYSDVEAIPLETSPECQIGTINKLVVKKDSIYIQDNLQNTLFVFNIKGEYLYKIDNIGKGPGEYKVLGDFWIDTDKKQIEILTNTKIIRYDFQGKFIEEIKLKKIYGTKFTKTSQGNYYVWSGCQLNKRKEKISNTKNGQRIKSLLNNITVNSNPVIFKLKFNDKLFDNLKH